MIHASTMIGRSRRIGSLILALATTCIVYPAHAQSDDAAAIVKAMAEYVASERTISLSFDTEIEVVTPEVQKIQFDSSGRVDIERPGKFRASRTGGYADVELNSDGKTVTIFGKHINAYAQIDVGGSIDDVVGKLRNDYMAELPAADLLTTDSYQALMEGVIDAKHIGRGIIDGVECEHLAFRTQDTDWQLWVEVGAHPVPRKYVITSKAVGAAPQYTIRIKDWKTGETYGPGAFIFSPPTGAKKVEITNLTDMDELPSGTLGEAK